MHRLPIVDRGAHQPRVDDVEKLLTIRRKSKARWGDLLKGDEVERTRTVDLGKLQMFFLRFILIIGYGAAVAAMLDGTGAIERLPAIDDGMNVLLGISHRGFLATKAGMRSADSNWTERRQIVSWAVRTAGCRPQALGLLDRIARANQILIA